LRIIGVGFDVTDELLIRIFAFFRYWRKNKEYSGTVHQLFIDFKKAYDSVRREVQTVPWLRRLVAGIQPWRPGFDPRSGNVGFVVDKVALGGFF
jgi:hypothetical protein